SLAIKITASETALISICRGSCQLPLQQGKISYVVIPFQSPESDALWEKPENHRRNFGFEHIAYRYSRRLSHSVDSFVNLSRFEVRSLLVVNGALDYFIVF